MFKMYSKVVRLLKKRLPPAFPVDVRRVKMTGTDGQCEKRNDRFLIRINRKLSEAMAIDVLLHEYAHARAWNYLHDKACPAEFDKLVHGPEWGVAYSEVYRVWEKFNSEE